MARFRTRGKGPTRKVYPLHSRGRSRLTYSERQKLPPSAFAIPEREAYPVPTVEQLREAGVPNPEKAAETHARNALARVAANGTESEKHRVCRLVATRHPDIHAQSCPVHGKTKSHDHSKAPSSRLQGLLGGDDEIFRTFDDVRARNAEAQLKKAGIPYRLTRSTEGRENQFKMVEFHTSPKHRNRAFGIIDYEVNTV